MPLLPFSLAILLLLEVGAGLAFTFIFVENNTS
jgi:hypothetical protein